MPLRTTGILAFAIFSHLALTAMPRVGVVMGPTSSGQAGAWEAQVCRDTVADLLELSGAIAVERAPKGLQGLPSPSALPSLSLDAAVMSSVRAHGGGLSLELSLVTAASPAVLARTIDIDNLYQFMDATVTLAWAALRALDPTKRGEGGLALAPYVDWPELSVSLDGVVIANPALLRRLPAGDYQLSVTQRRLPKTVALRSGPVSIPDGAVTAITIDLKAAEREEADYLDRLAAAFAEGTWSATAVAEVDSAFAAYLSALTPLAGRSPYTERAVVAIALKDRWEGFKSRYALAPAVHDGVVDIEAAAPLIAEVVRKGGLSTESRAILNSEYGASLLGQAERRLAAGELDAAAALLRRAVSSPDLVGQAAAKRAAEEGAFVVSIRGLYALPALSLPASVWKAIRPGEFESRKNRLDALIAEAYAPVNAVVAVVPGEPAADFDRLPDLAQLSQRMRSLATGEDLAFRAKVRDSLYPDGDNVGLIDLSVNPGGIASFGPSMDFGVEALPRLTIFGRVRGTNWSIFGNSGSYAEATGLTAGPVNAFGAGLRVYFPDTGSKTRTDRWFLGLSYEYAILDFRNVSTDQLAWKADLVGQTIIASAGYQLRGLSGWHLDFGLAAGAALFQGDEVIEGPSALASKYPMVPNFDLILAFGWEVL